MNKTPYFNDTPNFIFLGGVMVPPYSTREVDENLLPREAAAEAEAPETEPDELAELLKGNVAEVLAKLPELDLAAIEHLGGLEQTGQQRKGILGAIAERLLAEASKNEGGGL